MKNYRGANFLGHGPMDGPALRSRLRKDYQFRLNGIEDIVSLNSLLCSSAGPAYYIHPTTGELVTVPAGTPLNHPVLGLTGFGNYEQLCQDSEDPGGWVLFSGATRSATGETFGPFVEYNIVDAGGLNDGTSLWISTVSGAITSKLYGVIRYQAGTSNSIRINCRNDTTADESRYFGVIGEQTVTQENAGSLVIISDEYDSNLGYYTVKFSIDFTTKTDDQRIVFGPNSTDNSNIKVLGADVSEDRTILDFHVPSGVGDGVELIQNGFDTWTDTNADGLADDWAKGVAGNVATVVSDVDGMYQKLTKNGESNIFLLSDTNLLLGTEKYAVTLIYRADGAITDGTSGYVYPTIAAAAIPTSISFKITISGGDRTLNFVSAGSYIDIFSVSVEKITTGNISIGSRAGTITASEGKADGTIALDDDFSTDTSGDYSENDTAVAYNSGSDFLTVTFTTSTDNNRGLIKDTTLTIGKRYKATFKAKGTRLQAFTGIGQTGVLEYTVNPVLTSSWQNYSGRFTAVDVKFKVYQALGGISEYVDFDDIKVQEIPNTTLPTAYPKLYDALGGVADGVELLTDANATSDPNGNEANATTGFTNAGVNLFESQSSVVNTGTYALQINSNGSPSADARVYKDISSLCTNGVRYRLTFPWRHVGTGGSWNCKMSSTTTGLTNSVGSIANTATAFTEITYDFIYDATFKYLIFRERNADNDGGIYLDNLSLKQISPASATHSFDWTPGVDYSATSGIGNLLNCATGDGFFQHDDDGTVILDDGTTEVTEDPAFVAGVPYPIALVTGVKDDDTLSAEKVVNGDMESGVTNWTADNATVTSETTIVYAGSKSLKVVDDGSGAKAYQAITTIIGKTYLIEGCVYGASANAGSFLSRIGAANDFSDGSSDWLTKNGTTEGITNDDAWHTNTDSFVAEATTTYIILVTQNTTGDTNYFDAISIKATNQPKMQLQVKVSGTWQHSPVTDFDGSFDPGDALTYFLGNDYQNSIADHKITTLKQSDWKVAT
ncbi:MAG: hypothetical protein P9L97_06075 [Candidatus Tenebribacter davisii]|nr:hypothetical protein [Candidatus Tenebribacter davisii]